VFKTGLSFVCQWDLEVDGRIREAVKWLEESCRLGKALD
jgi:hypothetical protein